MHDAIPQMWGTDGSLQFTGKNQELFIFDEVLLTLRTGLDVRLKLGIAQFTEVVFPVLLAAHRNSGIYVLSNEARSRDLAS